MSNILVTGGNGQLGSEIRDLSNNFINYNFYFTDANSLDITNFTKVKLFIEENKINIIINCAAYTAVDKAETDIELCKSINYEAVQNITNLAKEKEIKLIHISTDYVFNGENFKPYIESDITDPKSIYGKTKLLGERSLLEINPKNSIIIRTSWVYSRYGKNFVKTMIQLGKTNKKLNIIFDQIGSPTYAKDLAKAIFEIIPQLNNKRVEVFHFSNQGVCSWYDFAKEIFEIKGYKLNINPINTDQYPTLANRPHYSVLNKSKITEKYNIDIPYWKDSLINFLNTNIDAT